MDFKPLNRGPRQNHYCGPAVISFLTGLDTDTTATLIREVSGQKSVKGAMTTFVVRSLMRLGLTTIQQPRPGRVTLAAWLKQTKSMRTTGRMFLVVAGNHFQLISGRRYACGRVSEIVSIRDPRVKRRARVSDVWEIVGEASHAKAAETRIDSTRQQRRSEYSKAYASRRKTYEFDKLNIVSVDYSRATRDFGETIMIYPGSALINLPEFDDPHEGDHLADDWDHALEMAREYQALFDKLRAV